MGLVTWFSRHNPFLSTPKSLALQYFSFKQKNPDERVFSIARKILALRDSAKKYDTKQLAQLSEVVKNLERSYYHDESEILLYFIDRAVYIEAQEDQDTQTAGLRMKIYGDIQNKIFEARTELNAGYSEIL